MSRQRGLVDQTQDSPFVKWIREEVDLPPEIWKQLYLVVVKRLEKRDRYLPKLLKVEAETLEITWRLYTKAHGDGPTTRAALDSELRKMEARRLSRGKVKPNPPVPYIEQFLKYEDLCAELEQRSRKAREKPGYVRGLINRLREKFRQPRVAKPVPAKLEDTVAYSSAMVAARSIVAHVCGGNPDYLGRKFRKIAEDLGRSTQRNH